MNTTNPIIERIKQSYLGLPGYRCITIPQLNKLGYSIGCSDIELLASSGKKNSDLLEVLDTDTGCAASFCLMYCERTREGFVLPQPYSYFIREEEQAYCFSRENQPA